MKQISRQFINVDSGPVRSNIAVNMFFMLLLATASITPIMTRVIPHILHLFIWGMWFLTSLSIGLIGVIKNQKTYILWWLLYVIMIFTSCIFRHSDVSINFLIVRVPTIFTIPFMLPLVICRYNLNEKLLVWKILVFVLIINLIHNIYLGIANPDCFRELDGLNPDSINNKTNAGDTAFVLLCLLSSALFWICTRCSFLKKNKMLYLFAAIVFPLYFIFINSRATTLLMFVALVFGFALSFKKPSARNQKKRKSSLLLLILLAGLILTVIKFIVPFMTFMISIFEDNQEMSNRFADILAIMSGDSSFDTLEDGSLAQRFILWTTSINTFFSSIPNFLIGVGEDVHDYDMASLIKCGVGGHSEYFDLAAKYGMLGIIIVFKSLKYFYTYIVNITEDQMKKNLFLVVFVVINIYGFLNGYFGSSFYILLLLIPVSFVLMDNKKI